MVAEYAEQLLQEHPEGSFNLAGWSLGGNLAMDVAARLEQRGRQAFVGWIDAAGTGESKRSGTRSGRRRASRTYPWARCGWNCSVSCFPGGPSISNGPGHRSAPPDGR
ncbi:thioesterase domain-containing protein [Pseudomonas aeruginosa]